MESLNTALNEDEQLYRAVIPDDMYWKAEGRISSAVFKDDNGVSTDREMKREASECVKNLLNHPEVGGSVVSVSVKQCNDVGAQVKYDPLTSNIYHTLIMNCNERRLLTDGMAKRLARLVRYDHLDSFGKEIMEHK